MRISARRNFSGGSEVHQGRACNGVAAWGVPGGSPPDAGEFFKNFENLSGVRGLSPPDPLRADPLTSLPLVDLASPPPDKKFLRALMYYDMYWQNLQEI